MKSISVSSSLSTGLDATLASARSIEIEDTPLGQGGFGIAYRARRINGRVTTPQVVKLLSDNAPGMAQQGFETIQELQKRLANENVELSKAGSKLLDSFPALHGIPQLSFEGHLNGRRVVGYTANDLAKAGMEAFSRILDDDRRTKLFQALPLASKMRMAAQLVAAFDFLSSHVRFIHADIKADALFVDLKRLRCAIIDFDSGALARSISDMPSTFGTKQDWLAPEIVKQLDQPNNPNRVVKVDLLSDVWSVNIAIHYLLFGFHPLFFLTEISDRSVESYFRKFQWPDVAQGFPYFRRGYATFYDQYFLYLKNRLPLDVVRQFAFTFNKGYRNPTARTTYGQWKTVLQVANRPTIRRFEADRTLVTDSRPVRLSWDTTGATRLELKGTGDVTARTWVDVSVKRDTVFELILTPAAGPSIVKRIRVQVSKQPPKIHSFATTQSLLRNAIPARLTWNVIGAERIEINYGIGDVTAHAFVDVLPKHDTTFTLTATSPFGVTASATVQLKVSSASPVIAFFRSDRNLLADQKPVELSWSVSDDAHDVGISGIGTVPRSGTLKIAQKRDTIYVLTATSYFGRSSSARLEVLVSKVPPVIETFTATPPFVREWMETKVTWKVQGAHEVRITPHIGSVPAEGNRTLHIGETVHLMLEAESFYGVSEVKEICVTVLKPTTLGQGLVRTGFGSQTALTPQRTTLTSDNCARPRRTLASLK